MGWGTALPKKWRCSTADCQLPEELHGFCWAKEIDHNCFGALWHQHWPKRSAGGKEIVAILCAGITDCIDNGQTQIIAGNKMRLQNDVKIIDGKRYFRIWERGKGVALLEKELPESTRAAGSKGADRVGAKTLIEPAAPVPSENVDSTDVTLEGDWSTFSDDYLTLIHETATKRMQTGLLMACKAIYTYRDNHVQQWGKSWLDEAMKLFGGSHRTNEGKAGFWSAYVNGNGITQENVAAIAESRDLVQLIGRSSPEKAVTLLEEAVQHVEKYAEAPTRKQLAAGFAGAESGSTLQQSKQQASVVTDIPPELVLVLREKASVFRAPTVRNNGPKYLMAFLESL